MHIDEFTSFKSKKTRVLYARYLVKLIVIKLS